MTTLPSDPTGAVSSPALRRGARRRGMSGMTAVEFALVAPLLFLVITGIVITGIVAMNQMQLSNVVREGARAAAICGGVSRDSSTTLPNGQSCTSTSLINYITANLNAVPGSVGLTVTVINGNSVPNDPNVLDECQKGKTVVVSASYPQPLYVPLVGRFLGDSGSTTTRTLTARAEATCEQ